MADGGEGIFAYNSTDTTTSDNGGTVIVDAIGNRWYRETEGKAYFVKWFDAVGNNVNDDTGAIQNTLTSAVSAQASMFFPSGLYKVSAALTATLAAGISIFGAGRGVSVISPVSTTADLFVISSQGVQPITFNSLSVNYTNTSTAGITFNLSKGSSEARIEDVEVINGWTVVEFGDLTSDQQS